jgi:outer membrane receptor protein involved in Fe transport
MIRFLALVAVSLPTFAQTITGTIEGSVIDPSGAAVTGAPLRLVHVATKAGRDGLTDARGGFLFTSLSPGEYVLQISANGFKQLERRGIRLTASEVLSLGALLLELGQTSEQVVVSEQLIAVQTASAERSAGLTGAQVENIAIRGRNVMNLLRLLPGVVDRSEPEAISRNWNVNVNGLRASTNAVMVDGMTVNAIGNNNVNTVSISLDAVAEVKVLLGNYQAEYGRLAGANVQIITKSGGKDFHGLGSYFKRHEQFNANNFFNNRLGQPRPIYRFNTWNYNVGGPAVLPGGWNRGRDKLFFFWSQEFWPLQTNQAITQLTMPSELERRGDFSRSLDVNDRVIIIRDPTSRQPFPGNVIPASQINPSGRALVSFFPMPNFFDRVVSAGRYNYVFQAQNRTPLRTHTGKIDFNVNPRNTIVGTFTLASDINQGSIGLPGGGRANWEQMIQTTSRPGRIYVGRYTRVFGPTLINELNAGFGQRPEIDHTSDDQLKRNQRETIGFRVPQFNKVTNPLGVIPNATFGGITQPGNLLIQGRFPHVASHDTLSLTNNLTKSFRAHTLKTGVYFDRIWRGSYNPLAFNGTFDFSINANNPLDTGHPYANALNGVFASYTEATARPYTRYRVSNLEWFLQDNWKVNRRLTLDFGLRLHYVPPYEIVDDLISSFFESRYERSRAPQLIRPGTVDGRRVGVHPVSGAVLPVTAIGAIADGAGDRLNGLVVREPGLILKNRGIMFGPRFGFAFDPLGDGKTAIRAGFGLFYNRDPAGFLVSSLTQTPIADSPIVFFSTFQSLQGSGALSFPQNINAIDPVGKVPSVMNMSFAVQRNVGFATVIDVAYVGSLGRNLEWTRNLNSIPFGANFLPQNADPTNPRVPLPPNFLRPYVGHGNITHVEFASSSSYHSLQVSANRRFSRGVQFGLAWTWSKAMDYNSADGDAISNLVNRRVWNYGPSAFDRTHVVRINWLYDLPNVRAPLALARAVLHNWQLSGIYGFTSGSPLPITFSTTTAVDVTGSPTDGARVVLTGEPGLPQSERTFSRNLRTETVRMPEIGTIGRSSRFPIRGPRNQNWDLTVFKNFPIRETMRFQLRWELYNAFNNTQFSTIDAAARFETRDPAQPQINARFGEFAAANNPRIMQFALRFYF